jgi:hypothetical protein
LLNQSTPAGPNRQAEGHLVLACGGPREKQIRHVRAGDEQDQRRNRRQNPQRSLELSPQWGWTVRRRSQVQRSVDETRDLLRRAIGSESLRAVAAQSGKRGLQHALRLLHPDILIQAAEHAEPVEGEGAKRSRVVHRIRQPHVRGAAGLDTGEAPVGHADDLERSILQRKPASDDRWIATESSHPERVAQDRDGMGAWLRVVFGGHQPSGRWQNGETPECIARQVLRPHLFLFTVRAGKPRRPHHLGAHGEEVDASPAGVAQAHE